MYKRTKEKIEGVRQYLMMHSRTNLAADITIAHMFGTEGFRVKKVRLALEKEGLMGYQRMWVS